MNKKGSTMVEAAMIFPLIILAVVGVIYIMIFFYHQVTVNTKMHMTIRQEAGLVNQTMVNVGAPQGELPMYKKGNVIYFQGDLTFNGSSILVRKNSTLHGSVYVVRGKEIVRCADLL